MKIEDNWYEKWQEKKAKRRAYLNKAYPNKLIQNLNVEHLRRIGYAIGIGSTDTKKELIDKIIEKQERSFRDNNIIIKNENGEFILNTRVNLIAYITK